MSDTPRTDAYIGDQDGTYMTEGEIAMCDFARTLERELNEARAIKMGLCGLTTDETYMKVCEANALREHIDGLQKLLPNDTTIREGVLRLQCEKDEARNQLARICKEGFDNQDTIGLETADDYVLRKLAEMREAINGAYGALSKIAQVGREYYDMDMGPNGEDSLAQADAALAKLEPFLK